MKNRSLYAVLTRFGIVAAVLTALLVIAPAAAQEEAEEEMGPCNDKGTVCSYDENGEDPVAVYSSADPEGAGVTWKTGGTDGSLFSAEGGELRFKSSPNYEDPKDVMHDADADNSGEPDIAGDMDDPETNNIYVVKVRATEVTPDDQEDPAKFTEIQVRVTVKNVDEDGEVSILVRQPQVQQAVAVVASDPDIRNADGSPRTISFGYLWSVPKVSRPVTGNNNHWVAASGTNDGMSYTPTAAEVDSVLRAQVSYTDGEGADKVMNILTELPVRAVPDGTNNMPEFDGQGGFGTRDVDENSDEGTLVGAPIVATDGNSDVLYYTLGGNDAASFAIDKITGQITVAGDLDHEAGGDGSDGIYDVTVTATDPSNGTGTVEVDITANDVNDDPTVAAVGTPTLSTPEIDSTPLESENYTYASALAASYTKDDVDEDDETEFMLAGDDAGAFNLTDDDNNGEFALTFKNAPNFDAPGDADKGNTYEVTVVATDKAGATGELEVTVEVTNVIEDGSVNLSTDDPAVGVPITATLDDPDTGETDLSWQWQSSQTGADGSFNNIEDATDATYTPKDAVPDDPETDANEAVTSDEGLFLRAMVTYVDDAAPLDTSTPDDLEDQEDQTAMGTTERAVRVAPDVNDPPAFESASTTRDVAENKKSGEDAGDAVKATDPDGDVLTYSITGGADMDKFGIKGQGQITVGSATFNYDDPSAQQTFEVEVTAMDPFGKSGSTMVTLTVTDFNEAPDFTAENPDNYDENGEGAVATFTATDPEGADVKWSTGGTDGSLFTAEGGELRFKDSPNYEDPKDVRAHQPMATTTIN